MEKPNIRSVLFLCSAFDPVGASAEPRKTSHKEIQSCLFRPLCVFASHCSKLLYFPSSDIKRDWWELRYERKHWHPELLSFDIWSWNWLGTGWESKVYGLWNSGIWEYYVGDLPRWLSREIFWYSSILVFHDILSFISGYTVKYGSINVIGIESLDEGRELIIDADFIVYPIYSFSRGT